MWYLRCVLKHCTVVIYACALSELLISSFSAILKSFCMNTGTNWYEIQRNTAINTRHRCIQYGVGQPMRVFCEFTRGNGVKHKLIAPHHPRSNCQAERFVQTFMAFWYGYTDTYTWPLPHGAFQGQCSLTGSAECIWRRPWQPQTVMNDPGAKATRSGFFDLGKGQTTTPGTSCPTLYE